MKKLILIPLVLLFIFCSSIKNKNVIFYENKIIENSKWNKDSIYSFNFEIIDTFVNYNIYFDLRNNNNYPFSNIFLFTKIAFIDEDENIEEFKKESNLQYIMASPDGRWLGVGITNIKKNVFLYDSNIKFYKKGIYQLEVVHGMRKDELEGLESLSLIIEKNIQ